MTSMHIAWSDGAWTNPPIHVEHANGTLRVTAAEGSDAWRHTSYGFVHDPGPSRARDGA